jgi:hypothetical protein
MHRNDRMSALQLFNTQITTDNADKLNGNTSWLFSSAAASQAL